MLLPGWDNVPRNKGVLLTGAKISLSHLPHTFPQGSKHFRGILKFSRPLVLRWKLSEHVIAISGMKLQRKKNLYICITDVKVSGSSSMVCLNHFHGLLWLFFRNTVYFTVCQRSPVLGVAAEGGSAWSLIDQCKHWYRTVKVSRRGTGALMWQFVSLWLIEVTGRNIWRE